MNWSPKAYSEASVLAQTVGQEMLSRLDWMTVRPKLIVDLGCGTGEMTAHLQARYPGAVVVGLDKAEDMVFYARKQVLGPFFLCGEGLSLPLLPHSVDLIFANLLLPWQSGLEQLLREWRRALRPEGLLVLSVLGLDTLKEWRTEADCLLVPYLMDMHDLGDALVEAGFAGPVLDVDYYTMSYRCRDLFVQELQASSMVSSLNSARLNTKADKWSAVYEVVFAHAFGPAVKAENEINETIVPLSQLRQQLAEKKVAIK